MTFAAAQAFLHDTDQAASFTDPGVLRALVGNAGALTLTGLLALGLGALLRSVPGAIGAFIGGVMILPEYLGMLPYDVVERAIMYFPTQAAGASVPRPPSRAPPPPARPARTVPVGGDDTGRGSADAQAPRRLTHEERPGEHPTKGPRPEPRPRP
ncbi:hypothetical protein SBADM41S_09969 [Streptomyces badius]